MNYYIEKMRANTFIENQLKTQQTMKIANLTYNTIKKFRIGEGSVRRYIELLEGVGKVKVFDGEVWWQDAKKK